MSSRYNEYIIEHKKNVKMAFDWLYKNLPYMTSEDVWNKSKILVKKHDDSKYDKDEYDAYDTYFYGSKSYQATVDFEIAWLKHIHKNQHHWQHWILHHDDPNKPYTFLPMPTECIIEMICDWWSFSWKTGNLYEIFQWYEEHKHHMLLNVETKAQVEKILEMIKDVMLKTYHENITSMVSDHNDEE